MIDPQPTLAWTNFSDVLVYRTSSQTRTLTINNNNGGPVTITDISMTSGTDFSYSLSDYSVIPSGGSRNVSINFLPTFAGLHAATFTVSFSSGVASQTVQLQAPASMVL